MTGVLLGLSVALCFGAGDFAGGRASVRASTAAVLVVAQVCSAVGALVIALGVHGDPSGLDIGYGVAAGVANVVGLGLLYDALARHAAAVVAPVTAVLGSVVPVVWGFGSGERPSLLVVAGVAVAIAAGALVAREQDEQATGRVAAGALVAVAAGTALGASLVLYSETSPASGQWPVVAARWSAAAAVIPVVAVLAARGHLRWPRRSALALSAGAGILDVAATALLVVAVRRALLVVVAPVASLAPMFTVLLAALLLGERISRGQQVALAGALAGLVLISTG